jgi:hypothetical protein
MTNDNDNQTVRRHRAKLAFMLAQLRDEIDDIIRGLNKGTLTHSSARDAATTQLLAMLAQLQTTGTKSE